eukprot:1820144-Prymnesium_polylepis.2
MEDGLGCAYPIVLLLALMGGYVRSVLRPALWAAQRRPSSRSREAHGARCAAARVRSCGCARRVRREAAGAPDVRTGKRRGKAVTGEAAFEPPPAGGSPETEV